MVRHFVELRAKRAADREALTESIYRDFSTQVNAAYRDVQPIKGVRPTSRANGRVSACT